MLVQNLAEFGLIDGQISLIHWTKIHGYASGNFGQNATDRSKNDNSAVETP